MNNTLPVSGRYQLCQQANIKTEVQVIYPPECNQFFVLVTHRCYVNGYVKRIIKKGVKSYPNDKYTAFLSDLKERGGQQVN